MLSWGLGTSYSVTLLWRRSVAHTISYRKLICWRTLGSSSCGVTVWRWYELHIILLTVPEYLAIYPLNVSSTLILHGRYCIVGCHTLRTGAVEDWKLTQLCDIYRRELLALCTFQNRKPPPSPDPCVPSSHLSRSFSLSLSFSLLSLPTYFPPCFYHSMSCFFHGHLFLTSHHASNAQCHV